MNVFAQIRKVDEEKRLVFGRAAEEAVDNAGEIMDYASSKPHFQKWSADMAKDTDGKSLGNVRAMHGKVAAGSLTAIDFNDSGMAIDVCAKIVDDAEWKKVLAGVYTGFSIGGSYVGEKKVEKVNGVDATRYTARPNEISLVDRPCMSGAKFFEVQKADGAIVNVDFVEAPVADDMEVNGTAEEVAEFGKLMNTNGLSIGDVVKAFPAFLKDKAKGKDDKELTDEEKAAAKKKADAAAEKVAVGALRKSMYSCSTFAQLIASLQSLQSSAQYEAYHEGDKSGIAGKLGACISLCGSVLKEMIDEELAEAPADSPAGAEVMAMADKCGALVKAAAANFAKHDADPIVALMKIGARNSTADTARLAKIHDLAVELGHTCEAPAAKAAEPTDLAKVDGALQKMVADAVAPLQKALGEAAAQIKKLEAQPAAPRVALRAVAKGDDVVDAAAAVQKVASPIVDDRGQPHEVAGLIKSLHSSGGQPLNTPLALRK